MQTIWWVERRERKERKKIKERKKERKEKMKRRKRKEETVALKQVGSSPTWDIFYLGAIQWPWSLAPIRGLVLHSFGQTVDRFSRQFMLETVFFVQVEPVVCYTCMLDFFIFFCYSCFKKKKKTGKNSSLCVFLFLMNSMLFGEK